ncbi:MAG: DNA-processing protein DprA [Candidatus Zixiibacteriota bacterium]|nr:MAG: DNA-processing protein DprA [candidate division Zixibacteria bacterium]
MFDENLAIWALAAVEGIGFTRIRVLIERFGKASAVFEQTVQSLTEIDTFNKRAAENILKPKDWNLIEKKFIDSFPAGSNFVSITDSDYPERLRNIPDPPPYFYFSGRLNVLNNPSLAVVGSRKPSDYGQRITRNIVGELAASGVTIVSGLAYGIDSVTHEAALRSGGKTVAVFGNSLDIIYPAGNRELADEIRKTGCLISEFPRGTKPAPYNFPVRNRIISGLCEGVLVVEAWERSGALITANHALEQGRDVLAIPGNIDNRLSDGPNRLLKQGAVPVSSARDIFDNFRWHSSNGEKRQSTVKPNLSGEEKIIFDHLSVKPVHLDELIRKAGLGPGKTAEVLLNLELKGFIMRKPGNYLVLT